MASSDIKIELNEYRPCLVGNRKALFHRWNEFNKPVSGGITPIDPPPGQIKYTLGLVEYEDGQVEEVVPHKIRFMDKKYKNTVLKKERKSRMKLYKTKIGKIINFIKNEGKFQRADLVEVLENNSKYEIYNKYIGQYAIVTNINYSKKNNIVGLKFLDGEKFDYKPCELRKCDYIEEMQSKEYKELLKMI